MSVPVSHPGSRPAPRSPVPARGRVRRALHRFPDTVRAYAGLTKTRIIEQLLVVTVPAMFLAERGIPPVPLILATLVGGAAAAASAHALNCVIDADIDVKMKRTARRPLAKGQVPPSHALVFGLVLAALSAPSARPNTSACRGGTWPCASGRRAVRFILTSMSASATQFSACALAAAIAPPRRVANTRPTGGIPRWARNIAGTVTTSSCSMMRVFVRPR